jgi:hypothetical protein
VNLRPADLEMFSRLCITTDLLERVDILRVTDREARENFGIRGSGDMSGIAFPYINPLTWGNGRRRHFVRIRRDFPDIEDGKEKKKYVSPYGDRKHLYFPPTPDLFADVAVPIVLVEAEKSVLALTAWSERTDRKVLSLGLGGCWGWRGQTGIKETATGERVPETGAIPDLNICRDGRKTYVLLDANAATNPKVQGARAALVRQLQRQRADVHVLDLPRGDWNGPDDWLGIAGDEAMTQLFEGVETGALLLNELERYIRRFVVLTPEQCAVLAVYILHTHVLNAGRFTPYIQVWSAVMGSGKTRVLEILELFVNRPWKTERVSAAALVRKIAKSKPTLLLDESDTAFAADKEYSEALRGILNAGFQQGGAAHVCVKKNGDWDVQEFPVFGAKVIAGIGMDKLPGTVRDRSIPIEMKRRSAGEVVEDFDVEDENKASRPLRTRIETWAEQNDSRLKSWPKPEKLPSLSDRQRDICNPLLRIAELLGGGWLQKLTAALTNILGTRQDDESLGIKLLSDLRDVFDKTDADRLPSAEIVSCLIEIQTSPWAELNQGKPISANRLARLLKPFRIFPRVVRVGEKTPAGYFRDSFADAWQRYLPLIPDTEPQQPQQSSKDAGRTHFSEPQRKDCVEDTKSNESPISMWVVEDVEGSPRSKGNTGYEDLELPCCIHGRHRMWWVKITSDGGEMTCGKCKAKPEAA